MDKDNAKSLNKHRQEYTQDFKREAVNLVETSGKSVPHLARDLSISDSILYKWQKQLGNQGDQAFPGKGRASRKCVCRLAQALWFAQSACCSQRSGSALLTQAGSSLDGSEGFNAQAKKAHDAHDG